jgi:hypothetical protein
LERLTIPSSGFSSPTAILNRVDLPEPLGPTRAILEPGLICQEKFSKSVELPNRCLISMNCSMVPRNIEVPPHESAEGFAGFESSAYFLLASSSFLALRCCTYLLVSPFIFSTAFFKAWSSSPALILLIFLFFFSAVSSDIGTFRCVRIAKIYGNTPFDNLFWS